MRCKINVNQIKFNTGKAMLISIPRTKSKFWIPSSLVYLKGHFGNIYLPSDMLFSCIRGKSVHFELTAKELGEKLGYVDKVEIVPKTIKPVKRHIPKELRR